MKYRIKVLGHNTVLSVGESCGKSDAFELLLKYGGTQGFELVDIGRKRTDDALIPIFLSAFFGSFRGYPECTVDVCLDGEVRSIEILKSDKERVAVKPYKCKVLCTKMHTFSDLTELPLITAEAGKRRIRIVKVESAESFSAERLSLMRALPDMPTADGAFAVSGAADGGITAVCDSQDPILYLALASFLSGLGEGAVLTPFGKIELSEKCVYLPVSAQCLS